MTQFEKIKAIFETNLPDDLKLELIGKIVNSPYVFHYYQTIPSIAPYYPWWQTQTWYQSPICSQTYNQNSLTGNVG